MYPTLISQSLFMKKFFTIFFVTLGVIFFILLLIAAYFFITDPLNLKPLLFSPNNVQTTEVIGTMEDKNPVLSPAQEQALETVGIDPAAVPTQFTPAQVTCFEGVLGTARVDEIKAGDTPTVTEFFKAKECL